MKLTTLAFAAALGLSAGAATAQPAPGPGPRAEGHQWHRPDPAQMAQRRAEMMQRHEQRLRDILQLRPDQEPALQALMASMKPPAGGPGAMMRPAPGAAPLTTPQRLDRMQAMMAEHMAQFQQHAAAVKRFYAQLTPAQQRAFDALAPMMMRHGMHGMHRMDGMHDGPGMRGGHGMGVGRMGGFRSGPGQPPPPPAG